MMNIFLSHTVLNVKKSEIITHHILAHVLSYNINVCFFLDKTKYSMYTTIQNPNVLFTSGSTKARCEIVT